MSDLDQITIRQISIQDKAVFHEALELLNRTQGRDLFGPSCLDERSENPSNFVVGAFRGPEVVAIGIAEIIRNFDLYLPFGIDIREEQKGKVVGSFATLCVHETLQGKGIGYQISLRRIQWLRSQGCDTVFGVSWVSGLAHTSNRLFERLGFAGVARLSDFYHQSSLDHPFVCPGCGDPPCTCAAILYKLELKQQVPA